MTYYLKKRCKDRLLYILHTTHIIYTHKIHCEYTNKRDRWRYENVEHKHKFRMLVVANTKHRWDPRGEICLRVIKTDQINRMTKEDGCLRSVGHDPHHHDTNTSNHCAPQQHPKRIIFTP